MATKNWRMSIMLTPDLERKIERIKSDPENAKVSYGKLIRKLLEEALEKENRPA